MWYYWGVVGVIFYVLFLSVAFARCGVGLCGRSVSFCLLLVSGGLVWFFRVEVLVAVARLCFFLFFGGFWFCVLVRSPVSRRFALVVCVCLCWCCGVLSMWRVYRKLPLNSKVNQMKIESARAVFREGLSPMSQKIWDRHLCVDARNSWVNRWLQGESMWDLLHDFENYLVPFIMEEIEEKNNQIPLALSR
jgi:hypothetical protein